MEPFVPAGSVVRKIWGKSDTILFIFAGAAAEFALNKAVDWLYFTGRLPADPIGRLFSTVTYARKIVFSSMVDAEQAIDKITAIHRGVEEARGSKIPDWAYRDVLFMLIHYSIAAFELLEQPLSPDEKQAVYDVFYRMGSRMRIGTLPPTYMEWLPVRNEHMRDDLALSRYTTDLFLQYKKHLGPYRFAVLKEAQKLVLPQAVVELLGKRKHSLLKPLVPVYKVARFLRLDGIVKRVLLPSAYKTEIASLDVAFA